MKKILYIKSNPKETKDSYSLQLADILAEKYIKEGNDVTSLNLYEQNINHLTGETMGKLFSGEINEVTKFVNDFIEYDEYIFATPMWNLSIPSILKTYIDHILVPGKTFSYTENGPKGLLENKKATLITARGGFYSEGPGVDFEMGDRYLKTILGFIGITDINSIPIEGTNVLSPEAVKENLNNLKNSL